MITRQRPFIVTTVATLLATTAFAQDGPWEIMVSTLDTTVPGVDGAVWVPNQWNNPTIDGNGNVFFRGQIGGSGITTANSRILVRGQAGAWTILARDGSPVPGNTPAGYVWNTTTGINGVSGSNSMSSNGGVMLTGNINGAGNTTLLDTAIYWAAADGTTSMLVRESAPLPDGSGAIMSGSMSAGAGVQFNDAGKGIYSTALTGGNSVTTNNAAVITISPSGTAVVFRKGSAAPGMTDGTTMTPDTFGLNLSGDDVAFGGTLVGGAVTTSNDKVLVTSAGAPAGQLRVVAREGMSVPGIEGWTFKSTSSFSPPARCLLPDGCVVFSATVEGAGVTAADDTVFLREHNGVCTVVLREGTAISGYTDGVIANWNFSGMTMAADGTIFVQGSLTAATNPTFVAMVLPNGTIVPLMRQGESHPSLAAGVTFASMNGSTHQALYNTGSVAFVTPLSSGTALWAWDATNGLRMLAATGDTSFTGTAATAITLIGGTGQNGNFGSTSLSENGWFVCKVSDSVAQIHTIVRKRLASAAPPCPADINDDSLVDALDLGAVLAGWEGSGSADVDGDGVVDATDLSAVLAAWGACQ